MANYSISQLIGKSLFAKIKLPAYTTTASAKPFRFFESNDLIGVLNSWITDKNGKIWFLFKTNAGQFVVPYIANSIQVSILKEQGAKTIDEERKAAEIEALKNNSPIEYYLKKYGFYVLGAFVAGKALQGYLSKK